MLLNDRILAAGNFMFKYRGYQFLIYLAILAFNVKSFYLNSNSFCYEFICFLVVLIGMLVRSVSVGYVSVGTSGRNCHEQEAATLNTTGMYSIVRNPLYIGNFFICLGIIMLCNDLISIVLIASLYWLFYMPIILVEENFLLQKFNEQYRQFVKDVNCLIPSFKNFKKANSEFSLHMVMMREHDTLLSTVAAFIVMLLIKDFIVTGKLYLESIWIIVSAITLIVWFILKYIKKHRGLISEIFARLAPVRG